MQYAHTYNDVFFLDDEQIFSKNYQPEDILMMQMGHEFTDSQVDEDSEEDRDDATAKENTENLTERDQDNNTD